MLTLVSVSLGKCPSKINSQNFIYTWLLVIRILQSRSTIGEGTSLRGLLFTLSFAQRYMNFLSSTTNPATLSGSKKAPYNSVQMSWISFTNLNSSKSKLKLSISALSLSSSLRREGMPYLGSGIVFLVVVQPITSKFYLVLFKSLSL